MFPVLHEAQLLPVVSPSNMKYNVLSVSSGEGGLCFVPLFLTIFTHPPIWLHQSPGISSRKLRLQWKATPGPALPHCLLVPSPLQFDVQWVHNFRLACHPGIQTKEVVQWILWWETLEEYTREFVNARPICNQHKPSPQTSARLLQPLPVLHCLWFHTTLDFVAGWLPANDHTTILTVVDRLSKMAHCMTLPKIPLAKETAELVLVHIFWLDGLMETALRCLGSQQPSSWYQQHLWVEYSHYT